MTVANFFGWILFQAAANQEGYSAFNVCTGMYRYALFCFCFLVRDSLKEGGRRQSTDLYYFIQHFVFEAYFRIQNAGGLL